MRLGDRRRWQSTTFRGGHTGTVTCSRISCSIMSGDLPAVNIDGHNVWHYQARRVTSWAIPVDEHKPFAPLAHLMEKPVP